MDVPRGYEPVRVRSARGFALPDDRAWVEALLTGHGSLYRGAARSATASVLQGREAVYAVESPGGHRVVRRYHRGGSVASLLGDRHLRMIGPSRPVREARASEEARSRGIPTPQVVAGVVYPTGIFYRADVVTEYLPDSVDLADVLFGAGEGPGRQEALERTGRLLARMAAEGIRHPDLNAKNVLFAPGGQANHGEYRVFLLDLDRCRPTPSGAPVPFGAMLSRLERSLRKHAVRTGRELSAGELEALRSRVRAAPGPRSP